MIQMSHLWLSILQPCTLTSVSPCVNHYLMKDSLMRPDLQLKVFECISLIKFLPSMYEAWVITTFFFFLGRHLGYNRGVNMVQRPKEIPDQKLLFHGQYIKAYNSII